MDSEKRNDNHNGQTEDDGRNYHRPKRRRMRWGRLFLLLVVLAVLLTSVFWGSVWVYTNIIHAPEKKVVAADPQIEKDEKLNQRINVLLLGIDDGDSEADESEPKRTDAMIVASFDPEAHKISLLSLPRDTMVILPGHTQYEKLNSAYTYGGVAMAKQTIANLLRIPIHYYALANWKGFIEIINLIGGVDLYVDRDMHYEDPYANLKIDIKHGYQHLDGEKSGQYVRFRSDELGDIGRVQRQQKFLKALGLQMFSIENITKIPKLLATAKEYIETDMDTATMLKAARSFNIMSDNNIKSGMLYGNFYDSPSSGISYWRSNRADIEKSLTEVDIPFMAFKEGSGDGDPVAGVDELGEGSNSDSPRKASAAAARRSASDTGKKAAAVRKSEPEKKATTQQKTSSSSSTSNAPKSSSNTSNAPKPSVNNEPKPAPKKNAPPVIRKPVVSNKPQPKAN
ncbi:MAG: LCP family protein [Acidaminococcaceae bacterium]|nr:LCP family protein [Acidaminococcaceae bacterium]